MVALRAMCAHPGRGAHTTVGIHSINKRIVLHSNEHIAYTTHITHTRADMVFTSLLLLIYDL